MTAQLWLFVSSLPPGSASQGSSCLTALHCAGIWAPRSGAEHNPCALGHTTIDWGCQYSSAETAGPALNVRGGISRSGVRRTLRYDTWGRRRPWRHVGGNGGLCATAGPFYTRSSHVRCGVGMWGKPLQPKEGSATPSITSPPAASREDARVPCRVQRTNSGRTGKSRPTRPAEGPGVCICSRLAL